MGPWSLRRQGRKQLTTSTDEQGITSAILKVSSTDQKTVYFLTGHGERASDSAGQDGYSLARQVIEQDNYVVKTATLAVTPTVPSDCAVLDHRGAHQAAAGQGDRRDQRLSGQGRQAAPPRPIRRLSPGWKTAC